MSDKILVEHPSRAIALAFGYKEELKTPDKKGVNVVLDNKTHRCCSCGRIHARGYLMSDKKELFSNRTNNFYSYAEPQSNFICEYCNYTYFHTDANANPTKKAITDCIVSFNKETNQFESIFCNNSTTEKKNNGVFNLVMNTPKPPFIVLLRKAKGTRFHDNSHTAVVTIDKEMLVLNYGNEIYRASRKNIINALEDFIEISERHKKLKVSDGLMFNNTESPKMDDYFSFRIRSNAEYHTDYSNFITKYKRGERLGAKIMLQNYLEYKKQINKKDTK